jgi:transcription antitermination factor NusG
MATNHGIGDRWLAGEQVPGVAFALHDAVEITAGPFDGECGTVALLMGLTPEASYLVTVRARGDVRVRQSALRLATTA